MEIPLEKRLIPLLEIEKLFTSATKYNFFVIRKGYSSFTRSTKYGVVAESSVVLAERA